MLKPNPQSESKVQVVFGRGGFGRKLGLQSEALMNGIHTHKKEAH